MSAPKRMRSQSRTKIRFSKVQPILAHAAAHLDDDLSLAALAGKAGLSPFHLQRVISSTIGETPKRLTLRLRLSRAATMLLLTGDSILDVALSCGFQSHEAFIRAFRRCFGTTPGNYRARGFRGRVSPTQAKLHAGLIAQVGPCLGLYHVGDNQIPRRFEMAHSIVKKQISPQPVLLVRRRIKPSDIAKTLGETLPQIVMYAQRRGLALAGQPFTRYVEWGPGLWTIEAGMPVTALSKGSDRTWADTSAAGKEITEDTLPGGPAATMTYTGSYDGLSGAHAAIQQWIQDQGLLVRGAPWEIYVTDPADYPDPKDWKTDLFWPLAG